MIWRVVPLLLLTGCGLTPEAWVTIVGGVTVGSVAILGRTPIDAIYSVATGKDCSAVRLEKGQTYCRPEEAPPAPQPYCTRSLGVVNCWQAQTGEQRPVAEGPSTLTAEQDANRTRTWPF